MIAPCHRIGRPPRPPEHLAGKCELSLCRECFQGKPFTRCNQPRRKRNRNPTVAGVPFPRAESPPGYSPGRSESASGGLGNRQKIVLRPVGPALRHASQHSASKTALKSFHRHCYCDPLRVGTTRAPPDSPRSVVESIHPFGHSRRILSCTCPAGRIRRARPPERRSVTGLQLTMIVHGCYFPTVSPAWTRKAGYKPALRTADRSGAVAGCVRPAKSAIWRLLPPVRRHKFPISR